MFHKPGNEVELRSARPSILGVNGYYRSELSESMLTSVFDRR